MYVKLLKNLLKCSPDEATVKTQLEYRSMDDIVLEMVMNARALFLKENMQTQVFEQFKNHVSYQKERESDLAQRLLKSVIRPYFELVA